MESSECFSVNNKSKFLVSINNKDSMKKFLLQAFAVAFCLSSGVFVASCDDDNNPVDNPPIDGETAYVVAATTGEASYLVVANSLYEGTVSTQGNGTEVIGFYKNGRPRYKKVRKYPTATTGETLAKACMTMEFKYGVKFRFCAPEESGKNILKILGVNYE